MQAGSARRLRLGGVRTRYQELLGASVGGAEGGGREPLLALQAPQAIQLKESWTKSVTERHLRAGLRPSCCCCRRGGVASRSSRVSRLAQPGWLPEACIPAGRRAAAAASRTGIKASPWTFRSTAAGARPRLWRSRRVALSCAPCGAGKERTSGSRRAVRSPAT